MINRLTTPALPFSGREILSHLREGSTAEIRLTESYLSEAVDCIEQVCERAISFCRFELVLPRFPAGTDNNVGPAAYSSDNPGTAPGLLQSNPYLNRGYSNSASSAVLLEMPPVFAIESIKYYADAVQVTMPDTDYQFQRASPGLLFPAAGTYWPVTDSRRDAVSIVFWAGESDELTWTKGGDPQFQSVSGYPWADGQTMTLRASGSMNSSILPPLADVPDNFRERQTYFVVDSDNAGSFNLSATAGGAAIIGGTPIDADKDVDRLYANQLTGTTAAALRKIATDSFVNRCSEGSCSCSGKDAESFMYESHLRKLLWRPVLQTM